MPHIVIKMFKGRTEEQKLKAATDLKLALCQSLGCSEDVVSVSVSDYTPEEWQEQYRLEIDENPDIVIKPNYRPEDLA